MHYLLTSRPEFTGTLIDEINDRLDDVDEVTSINPGFVSFRGNETTVIPEFIFERHRLPSPKFIEATALKPIEQSTAKTILGELISEHPLWTVQLIIPERDEENDGEQYRRMDGVWNTLKREGRKVAPDLEKRYRPPHRLKPGGILLKLLLTGDGLWYSRQMTSTRLTRGDGDQLRMKWDTLAPSRSYLKMEEALEIMQRPPDPGHKVIDLGAAPGGWTYSFLKRGCDVIAVDHGPMKLPPLAAAHGKVTHVKENGITYQPPDHWQSVDWLVADMLIAPGVAVGLLRRWLSTGKARHIICNIKLPQEKPYAAIKPVIELMVRQGVYQFIIKQLFHDRREVTLMAWQNDQPSDPAT